MKRATAVGESPSKRIKLNGDTPFDDPNQERNPNDVLDDGLKSGSGYITCLCFMAWKLPKKRRAILEAAGSASQRQRLRFEVEFTGACAQFFDQIELKRFDEFLLALKGARVEKNSSRLCNLPMTLSYEEGVRMRFLKRRGPCETVDTWELEEIARRNEDAWFLTPREPIEPTAAEHTEKTRILSPSSPPTFTATLAQDGPVSRTTEEPRPIPLFRAPVSVNLEPGKSILPNPTNDRGVAPHPPNPGTVAEEPVVQLSKKKQRGLRRLQKRAGLRLTSERAKLPEPAASTCSESMSTSTSNLPLPAIPSPLTTVDCISEHALQCEVSTGVDKIHRLGPKSAQAELIADTASESGYHPLRNTLDINALCNLIGVVVQASPPRKTTRDWSCNIKLVDPSNAEVDDLNGFGSFQINCFTKQYEQWLPQPDFGEVLVLRQIKITDYHGSRMGVGYSDRMKWAIYSPTTGEFRHGNLGGAPKSEGVSGGFGYQFSPFHQPGESVIGYCLKLAGWWLEVEKRRKAIGEVHQVGGADGSHVSAYRRPQRQHRFISEAGPDVQPSGYFDCTVEVLHGHMNDNGVYSLYITDYTVNPAITPVQAEWCPVGLADYVLKVEVWDAAVEAAQSMFAGEYYSIKNARMMMSHGGYVEGKLVEQKIRKLEPEEDADTDSFFKALLERKKAWQVGNSTDDKADAFEYRTIEEVSENRHFNCVVEVLHATYDGDGTSCLYVTDYTSRDELHSTRAQGSWATGLKGRILKIALFNNQVEMAKAVQTGSFYAIKKVRLRNSTTARQFQGQLGGMERLIFLLNPRNSDDKLDALKRRKEAWRKSLQAPDEDTKSISLPGSFGTARRSRTIRELEADTKCPNKSRIFARIVDFRPWNLSDAVIIHCTKCKQDLPSSQKACFKCDDTDYEYVRYLCQMYFLLQDEDGDQIYVSVNDESSVFNGLQRSDIKEDVKGYKALSNRLSKMLGNLLDIHEASTPGNRTSDIEPDTPTLSLIIGSWDVDCKRAYCLMNCEDLVQ